MKKKLRLYIFSLCAAAFGWFATSFAFDYFHSKRVLLPESKTVDKTVAGDDFERSRRDTLADIYVNEATHYTWEEILAVKDERLRAALIREYAASIPLAEYDRFMQRIVDMRRSESKGEGKASKVWYDALGQSFMVWLERDFDAALEFTLDQASVLNRYSCSAVSPKYLSDMLFTRLFETWMKMDSEECLAFVTDHGKSIPGMVAAMVTMLSKSDPQRAVLLLEKNPQIMDRFGDLQSSEDLYWQTFYNWAELKTDEALTYALSLPDWQRKSEALNGVICQLNKTDPMMAWNVIRGEISPTRNSDVKSNYDFYVSDLFKHYAQKDALQAWDWIQQGDFSAREKEAAILGFSSSMKPTQLLTFLANEHIRLSQDEREEIIFSAFDKGLKHIRGGKTVLDLTTFQESGSEEDSIAKEALFSELSEENKIHLMDAFYREGVYNDPVLTLSFYEQIPDKNWDGEHIRRLLESAKKTNPAFAAEFYSENIYGRDFTKRDVVDKVLFDVADAYYRYDADAAVTWANQLNDPVFQEEMAGIILLNNLPQDASSISGYVNALNNKDFAEAFLERVGGDLLLRNPYQYAQVLAGIENNTLAESVLMNTALELNGVSEDETLDFIDALAGKPNLQNYAISQLMGLLLTDNPRQALSVGVQLPKSGRLDIMLLSALEMLELEDPQMAEQWKTEHADVVEHLKQLKDEE